MFHEFVEHGTELPYRAALWLLVLLADMMAEDTEAIRHLGYGWGDVIRR